MSATTTSAESDTTLTPQEAWQKLERSKSHYDDIRRFASYVLTPEDEVEALALAEKQVWSWEQDRDRKVRRKLDSIRDDVAEFITDGLDLIWLLNALERGCEIRFGDTERTGETWTSSYGHTHHKTRKLGRADLAAKLVVLRTEEADELQWEIEHTEDSPIKWARPEMQVAAPTEHARMRWEHESKYRTAARLLSDVTPFRLWALVARLKDEVLDEMRGDFHILYADGGKDMGERLGNKVIEGFDKAIDGWVKEWEAEDAA